MAELICHLWRDSIMVRILFVDNDEDFLALAREYLRGEEPQFNIETVDSAQIALRRLEEKHFDVVVSDYQMPLMDGLEFLATLRQEGNSIPFVFFTGHGREEVAMRALNIGADYYLMKGGTPSSLFGELAHIISKVVDHKRIEEALRESEERYRSLVEFSPVPIFVHQGGKFLYVNPAAVELHGAATTDALLNKPLIDFVHPSHKPLLMERMAQAVEKPEEERYTHLKIIRLDHRVIDLQIAAKGIAYYGEPASLVFCMDITKEKQAEEALKESETKYRQLIEDQTEFVVRWLPDGTRTYVNPSYSRYFGKSSNELIGSSFFSDIHKGDNKAFRKKIESFSSDNPISTDEHRVILPDGKIRWNQWIDRAIFDKHGQVIGFQSVGRDITDRKLAEKALKESEERFRMIFNNISDDIFIIELLPDGNLGRRLQVNDAVCQRYGYSREELLQMKRKDLRPPEEVKRFRVKGFLEKIRRGEQLIHETIYVAKNGTRIPVEVNARTVILGNKKARLAVARDITERKQAEKALRESEERFRVTFEEAAMPMTILGLDGRFVKTNPALQQFLGYSDNELSQMTFTEVTHSDDIQLDLDLFHELLDGKRNLYQIEKRYIRKDGKIVWGNLAVSLVRDEKKQSLFVIGTVKDSTERKEAEEHLKRQKEELSEFAHAMAHDLKNRLLSIEGYAEILQAEYDKSYAKKIQTLAEDMNEFVRRSVTLADAGQIIDKTEELDLTQLVQEVAETIIPANVSFSNDKLPLIVGDRGKLFQVFLNLFENAITHGEPSKIEVRGQQTEDAVKILISNDGQPIPLEDRLHIFQRKFTTKPGRPGGGLGLTIVQRVVEAHGWQISLKDTIDTTFCITIPRTN